MGCGSSSMSYEEQPPPRSTSKPKHRHHEKTEHHEKTGHQERERERERERQRSLAINRERPMAWLFKYPDAGGPPPPKGGFNYTADSYSTYSGKNSRAMSTQNSGTSDPYSLDDPDEDPYYSGNGPEPPYYSGKGPELRALHVAKPRSHG